MISFSFPAEIYIANKPTDFRKCFDGLCGEIQSYLQSDPLSGALFVFSKSWLNIIMTTMD